jgi:prophage DNA circulation protein
MSWKDRLRPGIVLVSPDGTSFTAKWRGDDITIEKRVSRHAHPDQDFETAQDLGLQSPDFPLTFYFDGSDHDLTARRFAESMAERGAWTVNHPVYGSRRLQPVKITVKAHPAESGNVTEISGDWFEPADPGESPPDAAAAVEAACSGLAKAAQQDVERAAEHVKKNGAAALQAAAKTFKDGYKSLKQIIHTANKRVTGIMDTINDLSTQAALEIASLSGAVIQLMESPGLFLGNCASRVTMFVRLGKRIMTDLPAAAAFSLNKIAAALSGELWLSAITAGMGTTIIEAPPATRAEALAVLARYKQFTAEARAALDAIAEAAAENPIHRQYVPGAASTEALLQLNAAVERYLVRAMYGLSAERRIVLDRPRSPLEICVTELRATSGNFDGLYRRFCQWNNLHGRRLLLLDAGEEVVIYA